MARDIREPWFTAMVEAKLIEGRTGKPSVAALSRACGLSQTALARVIDGVGTPRLATTIAIAEALGQSAETIEMWAGVAAAGSEDSEVVPRQWVLPEEAVLLTARERRAVEEMIVCLALSRRTPSPDMKPPSESDERAGLGTACSQIVES